MGGSGSFRVSGGVVGHLGFRDGVSASYSYFRCVGNFDISHTPAVWLSPAFFPSSIFISYPLH